MCDFSKLVTLYVKLDEVYFCLLSTSGLNIQGEKKKIFCHGLVLFCQNLECENSSSCSANCVVLLQMQYNYFSSFHQSNHCFLALLLLCWERTTKGCILHASITVSVSSIPLIMFATVLQVTSRRPLISR